MKRYSLRTLVFLAIACDLGLLGKRILAPVANLITDSLHIPGGVSTGFSLMFLVVAAALVRRPGCAAMMGLVQSGLALAMGSVGSMGVLAPLGYILPAVCIDLALYFSEKALMPQTEQLVLANAAASVCAAFTANVIVFRLPTLPLCLYLSVAAAFGCIFGYLGAKLAVRLAPVIREVPQ